LLGPLRPLFGFGARERTENANIYFDVLTSDQMPFVPDKHAVADLQIEFDPSTWAVTDFDFDAAVTSGDGIGNGYVSYGNPITWAHEIPNDMHVNRAFLFVLTADDQFRDGTEQVMIELDEQLIIEAARPGGAIFGALLGSGFDPDLLSDFVVNVVAGVEDTNQDYIVRAAALVVDYSAAAPIPEPSSALLFMGGALLVGGAVRRKI
jgi:hypothetical protein